MPADRLLEHAHALGNFPSRHGLAAEYDPNAVLFLCGSVDQPNKKRESRTKLP
jgi:hypothetical protein